jgi:hypothetical protein
VAVPYWRDNFEEEQLEFKEFLQRLCGAKDRTEFDRCDAIAP